MATIAFKGNSIQTSGSLISIGENAPDFTLANQNLEDVTLRSFGSSKRKILNIFPSLDTNVCSLSVQKFYQLCKERNDVVVLNISMDLPFAQGRFCKTEKLENCQTLSAFRSSFPKDYGLLITTGPLKGLCSRAVIVMDEQNKIIYTEQVPEIAQEPSYQKAIEALK